MDLALPVKGSRETQAGEKNTTCSLEPLHQYVFPPVVIDYCKVPSQFQRADRWKKNRRSELIQLREVTGLLPFLSYAEKVKLAVSEEMLDEMPLTCKRDYI